MEIETTHDLLHIASSAAVELDNISLNREQGRENITALALALEEATRGYIDPLTVVILHHALLDGKGGTVEDARWEAHGFVGRLRLASQSTAARLRDLCVKLCKEIQAWR